MKSINIVATFMDRGRLNPAIPVLNSRPGIMVGIKDFHYVNFSFYATGLAHSMA